MALAVEQQQTGRRRVLDAAAELFVAQGYTGTTLRQIGAAAGIKAASIYHHFDAKDSLFVAVLQDGIDVMLEAFDRVERETDGGAGNAERLGAHVQAHLQAVFVHGPYTTAHVTSFFSAPAEVRTQVVPIRDGYEARWSDLFDRLFSTQTSDQRRLHRLILFGAMNATAEWFDPSGNTSIEDLATTITTQFLTGVEA